MFVSSLCKRSAQALGCLGTSPVQNTRYNNSASQSRGKSCNGPHSVASTGYGSSCCRHRRHAPHYGRYSKRIRKHSAGAPHFPGTLPVRGSCRSSSELRWMGKSLGSAHLAAHTAGNAAGGKEPCAARPARMTAKTGKRSGRGLRCPGILPVRGICHSSSSSRWTCKRRSGRRPRARTGRRWQGRGRCAASPPSLRRFRLHHGSVCCPIRAQTFRADTACTWLPPTCP